MNWAKFEDAPLFTQEFKDSLKTLNSQDRCGKIRDYLMSHQIPYFETSNPSDKTNVKFDKPASVLVSDFIYANYPHSNSAQQAFELLLHFSPVVKAAKNDKNNRFIFAAPMSKKFLTNQKSYERALKFCISLIEAGTRLEDCRSVIKDKLAPKSIMGNRIWQTAPVEINLIRLLDKLSRFIRDFENRNSSQNMSR